MDPFGPLRGDRVSKTRRRLVRVLPMPTLLALVLWVPAALALGGGGNSPSKAPPVNTALPTISGQAQQGSTLSASTGSWSGNPTSYAYSWRRCDSGGANCQPIANATASSYLLTASDVGSTLRVVVTATNASGSTSATSAATAVVTASSGQKPVNTALPTISGQAQQGSALSASTGSWSGSPTRYVYSWRRCDSGGANCRLTPDANTTSSYLLASGDVGSTLRVVVTATNAYGSTSATSAATAVVTPYSPSPSPGVKCKISNRTTWSLCGSNCQYGTIIRLTNEQFHCAQPLSNYGPLPVKVVWKFTATPDFGDQGYVDLVSGCRGDSDPDTIDLIIDDNADGVTVGARGGAGKFRTAGPVDIQLTGKLDCGPLGGSLAHQDVWQVHPTHASANLAIVNGYSGNWDAGRSTCIGAGGAIFWSDQYDLDVYGGKYVTCNHGLFAAGQTQPGNVVVGASFRTGRVEPVSSGGDPVCQGYYASEPCLKTAALKLTEVTCQQWNPKTDRWEDVPPK